MPAPGNINTLQRVDDVVRLQLYGKLPVVFNNNKSVVGVNGNE